ncbi:MAG: replication protein RepA [Nitrospinota bacterium]
MDIKPSQEKLICEALAIEVEEAKKADALGFMARALVQATMPHSAKDGTEFQRRNGAFTLTILTPSSAGGLPYGSYPRLLLAWMVTEAVKKKNPHLELGESLSQFMGELGLLPTGGRWGTITALKSQARRLFSSSINCDYSDDERTTGKNVLLVNEYDLWWAPKKPDQASLWQSSIDLNENFFKEVTDRPVPIDLRALKALKRSPMALDIYSWLTYRMSYLRKQTCIPWGALQLQFGSEYRRTRDFKKKFIETLKKVSTVYPELNIEDSTKGLILKPSRPHIAKASKKVIIS